MLREKLRNTGCGSLGASAWISPYDFSTDIMSYLEKTGLKSYVEFFKASYSREREAKDFAMRVWGIHALEKQYNEFLRIYKPLLVYYGDSIKRKRAVDTEACFALRFQLMSEYIAIRLRDPMLPLTLLPSPWAGAKTQKLLSGYWHLLSTEANKFVDAVFAGTQP
jgi:phenylacetic acid degradation operon negative regulatory protein